MRKITLLTIAVLISTFSFAQFQDDFDPAALTGWAMAQGAQIKSAGWPGNTASANAITTAGVGGNSPSRFLTPVVAKTGSTVQVCLNIWLMNSNYNGIIPLPCATTMNVQFIKSSASTMQDVDIPGNILATIPGGVTLPTMGGQTCFQFTFPASVTDPDFRMLINFQATDCNQSSNKMVIDNVQISGVINTGCDNSVNGCGASDNNCPPQPLKDNFSLASSENSWSGVLYGKNSAYPDMGAGYKADVNGNDGDANNAYSQVRWSYVAGSLSPAGAATVSVNSNGTFSFTRTATNTTSITFQYNMCDNGLDGIAGNCDDRCTVSPVTVAYASSLLPVKLVSFNVSLKDGYATLYWTTAWELDSKGFEIERKTGNGAWKTVGFVATRSAGSSSTSGTDYRFTDAEAVGSDVRYYRLKEVSVDNQYTYSDIQVVRGRQSGFEIMIYPNPAEGGRTNISLPQGSDVYTVTLQDVNGRTLAGWKNTTGGTFPVTGLPQGFYFIQAQNITTGEKKVQKLVVGK